MEASRVISLSLFGMMCLLCGTTVLAQSEGSNLSQDNRVRICSPVSAPSVPAGKELQSFTVNQEVLDSPEWQDAIKRALSHQSGRGYYTLMRFVIEDAAVDEKIHAQGIKLKDLTVKYDGGGGLSRTVPSGGFIFLEHINSSRRTNEKDPVNVSVLSHGITDIWVDVPPKGILGVTGDVILRRCPPDEMGTLVVNVDAVRAVNLSQIAVASQTFPIEPSREFRLQLPPSTYQIRFPEFGLGSPPTPVTITAGATSRLKFSPRIEVVKLPPPVPAVAQLDIDGELHELVDGEWLTVDQSVLDSPDWQAAIDRQSDVPAIRSGHGQMTLLRIILKDAPSNASIQVTSTKVVAHGQTGGGMYRELRNGEFIVIEHIHSTNRREGKDPFEIGSDTHHRTKLYVPVPPRGKLGVLGDIVLNPCPPDQMGRIVVTVEASDEIEVGQFRLGPVAVGGPYGKTLPFKWNGTCDTGPLSPGTYKVLLPNFNQQKSRWDIDVLPGKVMQIHFSAATQDEVTKIDEFITSISTER